MKKIIFAITFGLILLTTGSIYAFQSDPTALEIIEKSDLKMKGLTSQSEKF